jgi:hypothetical protein
MVTRLSLIAATVLAAVAGPAAAQSLSLTGEAGQTATLTAAELSALPHVHVSVKQHGQVHTYDGVLLGDILAKVGAPRGEAIRGPELATVVRFTAKDGYQVVLDLAQTDPITRTSRVIVADREAGAPLKPEEGPFRLVIEDDLRPARSAHQVERIEVLKLATTAKVRQPH